MSVSTSEISSMEVNIWPEYDQPSVLVIYRVSFNSLTNFPSSVSFKIPTSAGNPYSVAMKDVDGLLYDLEYSVTPEGSWNRINFITSTPDVQLEFYDPYLEEGNGVRSYTFRWISDYPIDDLKVVVQQPRFVPSITISPDFGVGKTNTDDHLKYYTSDFGSLNQGSYVIVSLSYDKTDSSLSASTLPVSAVSDLPKSSTFGAKIGTLLTAIWDNRTLTFASILILVSFALMIVVALLALQRRNEHMPVEEASPKDSAQKKRAVNTSESREVYCHVCGKRARAGDLYCRVCGSKLIQR